jgi:hypothetical protein
LGEDRFDGSGYVHGSTKEPNVTTVGGRGNTFSLAAAAAWRPFRLSEIELFLLRAWKGGKSRQRQTKGTEDPQTALDPIGTNRIGDGKQVAAWITDFGSFHGAILKHGVGHRLSYGKK